MTFINPITASALPAGQAQERLAADKARQIRRQQVARRVVAASATDRFDHVVENAEAVTPIGEETPRNPQQRHRRQPAPKRPSHPDQEPPQLDVRA